MRQARVFRQRMALAWLALLATWCVPAGAEGYYRAQWALLVGVGSYADPSIPPLRFAANDVDAMRRALAGKFGFAEGRIVALKDARATKDAVVREFGRLADPSRVSPEDSVLVYLSGHGQTVPLPQGGEMGFILPHDASIDLKDVANPAPYYQTCLGMDELRRLSTLIPARHVLFLVDACYSGLAIEGRRGLPGGRALRQVATRPARQIIVAGLRDEQAIESQEWQHGAFTYELLRGLESAAADLNHDGAITGLELAAYLRGAVPAIAEQTPQYAAFDGDGEFILSPDGGSNGSATAAAAMRIVLTDPPDASIGTEEILARPLGDEVPLKGVVAWAAPGTTLSVAGRTVPLSLVPADALQDQALSPGQPVMAFQTTVPLKQGEEQRVDLRARRPDGVEALRRVVLRSLAADRQPPDVLVTEILTQGADSAKVERRALAIGSKGLVAGSKGLVAASKALVAVSKTLVAASKSVVPVLKGSAIHRIAGFARDDRSVVAVTVDGHPAQTRPATPAELDGLGWASGTAFDGAVKTPAGDDCEVALSASDGAGNTTTVEIALQARAGGPEIRILEPSGLAQRRGTSLVLPPAATTLRVTGMVRGELPLRSLTVAHKPVETRPASPGELEAAGWAAPAVYFGADVPVSAGGDANYLEVMATDAGGTEAIELVPARRAGGVVDLQAKADKATYRLADAVHFTLRADRECYVYLLHQERNGSLSLFLPNPVEPDSRLAADTDRAFPCREDEARWLGRYALVAQEPIGTDTLFCLAVPTPLPASLLESLTHFEDIANALQAAGRHRGARLVVPTAVREEAMAGLAKGVGGAWAVLRYQVTR